MTEASDTRAEWNGLIVERRFWEIRQPQDFVKGVADDQSVPDARSELATPFVGPISTNISADVSPGATFLPLDNIAGFNANDNIGVMIDGGTYFNTKVSGPATPTGINIADALAGYAVKGSICTNYRAAGP